MPTKKKGGKKKGGKKKKSSAPAATSGVVSSFQPLIIESSAPAHVTLQCELLNWRFGAFELLLPVTTSVGRVRQRIAARHGRVSSLKLYRGQVGESFEIVGEEKTLEEAGIGGGVEGTRVVKVVYDFKPSDHDDPLLKA